MRLWKLLIYLTPVRSSEPRLYMLAQRAARTVTRHGFRPPALRPRFAHKELNRPRTFLTEAIQSLSNEFLDLALAIPYPQSIPPYSGTIILVTVVSRLLLTVPFSFWVRVSVCSELFLNLPRRRQKSDNGGQRNWHFLNYSRKDQKSCNESTKTCIRMASVATKRRLRWSIRNGQSHWYDFISPSKNFMLGLILDNQS